MGAVRNTVIEGKGDFDQATFKKNQEVMANLWNEIAELADFNKDGEVSSEEFKKGIEKSAKGKAYADLPAASKYLIDAQFRTIDVDGDGSVGLTEYRVDCVNRMHTKISRILMLLTKNCSTMTTKRPVVLLWLATKNCTLNSLATLMKLAMPATSSALLK